MVMLDLCILGAVLLFLAGLAADTWRLGAPPMPSGPAERRAVVALVGRVIEDRGEGLTILEAGAGWGGLALAIARAHPGCRVVAVEGAWIPGVVCAVRARLCRVLGGPTVEVRFGDARRVSVDDLDLVVAFLGPEVTRDVADALLAGRPRLEVISVGFGLPGWQRRARIPLPDAWRSEVALWRPPAPDPLL